MDIPKSSDHKQPKSFEYNPISTGIFVLSMLVIGGVSYLWGNKDKEDISKEFNEKTCQVNLLKEKVKTLESEITELKNHEKTEKENEIKHINEKLVELQKSLSKMSEVLEHNK